MNDQPLPSGPPARGTCQTCRFGAVSLHADNLVMACRANAPNVIGTIINVETPTPMGVQVEQRWVTQSVFPSVGKDDWCGQWQQDPNAKRPDTSLSLIASSSDKAS